MATLLWDEVFKIILQQGFIDAGWNVCEKVDNDVEKQYKNWLNAGFHADMQYLGKNVEKRFNPGLLVDGTQSIITMLFPWPVQEPIQGRIKISGYALGIDYHFYLREKALPILKLIERKTGKNAYFFTDSAPIMDRYWAWKAGLGFIGKNGQLIHPAHGSKIFISHIFTSAKIEGKKREVINNACGKCKRCMDACPTKAIVLPSIIDSNKCIAYWTIEAKKVDIPDHILKKGDGWIFGCDICTNVCPYNHKKKLISWENNEIYNLFRNKMFYELMSRKKFTPMNRVSAEKIMKLLNYYTR
ncbi:MAG: tRNA epoxyqueuosine(34) reductase QueG [Bacteroidales bacterium]|nr:tRNA epoxyqueuosine(34) reductase QueG [Bacteroidales bacterium]